MNTQLTKVITSFNIDPTLIDGDDEITDTLCFRRHVTQDEALHLIAQIQDQLALWAEGNNDGYFELRHSAYDDDNVYPDELTEITATTPDGTTHTLYVNRDRPFGQITSITRETDHEYNQVDTVNQAITDAYWANNGTNQGTNNMSQYLRLRLDH